MPENTLFVCVLCRFSDTDLDVDGLSPGQILFDRLSAGLATSDQHETVRIQPVRCLGACSHACAVAFVAAQKLTFVLSDLSPTESVADLLQFSGQYAACSDGRVPYKERPDTVKQKIHAVLPMTPLD